MDMPLALREAIVTRLRGFAPLLALVPAVSIHGERVPNDRTFPFIMVGDVTSIPFRMACHDGEEAAVMIHAFAKGESNDAASNIASQIAAAFKGDGRILDGFDMQWTGGSVIKDTEEPDAWHSFLTYTAA